MQEISSVIFVFWLTLKTFFNQFAYQFVNEFKMSFKWTFKSSEIRNVWNEVVATQALITQTQLSLFRLNMHEKDNVTICHWRQKSRCWIFQLCKCVDENELHERCQKVCQLFSLSLAQQSKKIHLELLSSGLFIYQTFEIEVESADYFLSCFSFKLSKLTYHFLL